MHNLEQQPLHDEVTATQTRAEQPDSAPLTTQESRHIAHTSRRARRWRVILSVGSSVLLILALILVGVLATDRSPRRSQSSGQPQRPRTVAQPGTPSFSIPIPTATPLQTPGVTSYNLSTSLVNGVAYIGTANNAVYALRMSDGKVLWQQQINGVVDQQPLVLNGTVYINAFVGQNGPDTIYALRADNGSILWRFVSNDNSLTSNNYTYLSSAAGNDSTLYLVSQTGASALNTSDGRVRWHVSLPGTGDNPPVIANGVVYATSSTDDGVGTLAALRASDGALLWKYTQGHYVSVSLVANSVVYLTSNGAIAALRASNGKVLWQRPIDAMLIQETQLVNGVIYATGTKIIEPPTASTLPSGPRTAALSELMHTIPARPTLPFKEGISSLYAIQASNGKILWSFPLLNGKNSWTSWFAVQNATIYISASATDSNATGGAIYALKAQNGKVIWYDTMQASPDVGAPGNGVIYLDAHLNNSSTSAVYALRADTGAPLWSYPLNGSFYATSTLAGSTLYVSAGNGCFYALKADNGTLLWHYQTNIGA